MKKLITAVALTLFAGVAYASPGDDGCIGNCPQNGGGQPTTVNVTPTNTNTNTNNNTAVAGAISGSSSNSTSGAIAGGGDADVRVGVSTGAAASGGRAHAEGGDGGDARAYGGSGGDSRSRSEVGDTSAVANSGGNDQSVSDNSTTIETYTYRYNNDYSAASAASVYGDICTGAMSGQVEEGGFAVTNPNAFCNHMAAAFMYREAFEWEMRTGVSQECMAPMEGDWTVDGAYFDTCDNPKAKDLLNKYYEQLDDAYDYMQAVEVPAKVDGFFGYMVRPVAVIAALILLL